MNSLLGGSLTQLNPSHVGKHRLIFVVYESPWGSEKDLGLAEEGSGVERHVTACRRGRRLLTLRVLLRSSPASPFAAGPPAASSCLLRCWTAGKLGLQPQGNR